tara:strand:+ start:242 stop:640 length:399 start_codon:yes stop_codon:yes gene_type:complete
MGAFDSAWDLLKMRSSGGVRKPGGLRRFERFVGQGENAQERRDGMNRNMPPQQPVQDRGISVDDSSFAEIKRQAAQAQRQKDNHLQNLKQTDPEAYQKYLMEMSMGVGAGAGVDTHASSMAEMLNSMKEGNQ